MLSGCGAVEDPAAAASQEPAEISDQEDAVCGMIVREQSAPRGQLTHGDGSRLFFCSIGDLLVYQSTPSRHGRTEAVFVEAMRPDQDPGESHTGVHAWVRAEDAFFVVGIERSGIMGEPVLSYATRADAQSVVERHAGARILDAAGLREWWARKGSEDPGYSGHAGH